jgi:hypothetical protein
VRWQTITSLAGRLFVAIQKKKPPMFQDQRTNPYSADAVSFAQIEVRAAFIRRTYTHLMGAVLAFVLIETALFTFIDIELRQRIIQTLFGSMWNWLGVLVAFMAVSWIAEKWASSGASTQKQYLGLSLYVVAESLIFAPLLFLASMLSEDAIPAAAVISLSTFGGLTAIVFITRSDLAGWSKYLYLAGFAGIGLIIVAIFTGGGGGFELLISGFFVVLAGGFILYQTSNVLHHYREDQHVAASLALFAALAMLFWWVLRIVLFLMNRD